MLWTSKEFCELTGISYQTLRYYVDVGLIKPAKVGENKYRYYSEENILPTLFIRKHRGMGSGMDEVVSNLTNSSVQDQISWYEQHERKLYQQKELIQKQIQRVQLFRKLVSSIQTRIGHVREETDNDGRDVYRVLWEPGNDEDKYAIRKLMHIWMQYPGCIYTALSVSEDELKNNISHAYHVSVGIGMNVDYVRDLGLCVEPPVEFFPRYDNVSTICAVKNPLTLSKADIAPLLDYIEIHSYKIVSNLSGRLLAIENKDDEAVYYFSFRISVDK